MTHKNMLIILLAVMAVVTVSGCGESSRIDRVRPRWERTMDQARLQAAEKSFESGQTAYAERLLSDCRDRSESDAGLDAQIQQLRTRIQAECYAKTEPGVEETAY